MNKYTKLKEALIRAKAAAQKAHTEDNGSCNFDEPVILYKKMGYEKQKVIEIAKELNLYAEEPFGIYWKGCITISGATEGYAMCRTAMAEAFTNELRKNEVESYVHYQLD